MNTSPHVRRRPTTALRTALLRTFLKRRWRGFETLYRITGGGRIVAQTVYGTLFALDPHEYVDAAVLRYGFYESEVQDALRLALRPGNTFWDIGACFGLHAVSIARRTTDVAVHAFEPNPAAQRLVAQNAALNHATVQLHRLALGEAASRRTLHVPAPGNMGMATLETDGTAFDGTEVSVEVTTAERVIDDGSAPLPNVVKLDVEGAELAVLRGFGRHLADPRLRAIVLEAAPSILARDSGDAVGALLRDHGFQLRALARNEPTVHALINVVAEK